VRSVTLAQAALFAAAAMALLAGFSLADNFALLHSAPALVLMGSIVPSVIWAGFFFAVYRGPSSARAAAWITLVFAVLLEAVVVCIRFQRSVNYWTPFGNALSLSGWLLRLAWAAFLISLALAPDRPWRRRSALLLAILSAPSALSAAYDTFNNAIGFLFDNLPAEALWRALITPGIRSIYWLSQIAFLWTAWGKPEGRNAMEPKSSRLAP